MDPVYYIHEILRSYYIFYFVTNWDISVNCNLIHSNHVFLIWSREKDADVSWGLVMDMGMFIRSMFPSFSLVLMISLLKCTFMFTPDLPFPGQWPPCNAGQHQRCSTGDVCPPHRDDYLNNLLQVHLWCPQGVELDGWGPTFFTWSVQRSSTSLCPRCFPPRIRGQPSNAKWYISEVPFNIPMSQKLWTHKGPLNLTEKIKDIGTWQIWL